MDKFERLDINSRRPRDAVIVTIRQGLGRIVADVATVDDIAALPMAVPKALIEAAMTRDRLGLTRIAIIIEDEGLWKPEWGQLTALAYTANT